LDKAIEIKRRAQRCVQNGDLDGALAEYEKLVAIEDSDPYNYVLLADLLFKKGEQSAASSRYLHAAEAYERAGLYKNGIAVCKKMLRLSLSQSPVLLRLAVLHELDGISTEAGLYYTQYAEALVREDHLEDAATHFRKAFEVCPESARPLERLAEVEVLRGDRASAAAALREAASYHQRSGQLQEADRCRNRAAQIDPGGATQPEGAHAPALAVAPGSAPAAAESWEPGGGTVLSLEPPDAAAAPVAAGDAPAGPPRLDVESHRVSVAFPPPPPRGLGDRMGPPRLDAPVEPAATAEAEAAPSENGAHGFGPPGSVAPDAVADEGAVEAPLEDEDAAAADDERPGLAFDAPAATPAEPEPEPEPRAGRVEMWLAQAQEHFRAGNRDAAGAALAAAAREYDAIGQHDSAATIYRSLGKSAHATTEVLDAWLRNCEARRDGVEAAQVACDLGDRALNDGDGDAARAWFERALTLDPGNAIAPRRMQRLSGGPGGAPAAPAPEPAAGGSTPAGLPEPGRVEVAVGRGEAVTFDLGSLVAEFQRGVEIQISGDPQGHYDLGMAYREMGLLEQAVESFRLAAGDPSFAYRSAEMIGRCMLDQGRFDEAADEFRLAISSPGVSPDQAADLRFQLGLSLEAAGDAAAALAEFEQVYAAQSNYPDVAVKIRVLRKSLEGRPG
jgi:tetratricopeptide (TPR) repeat protein